MPCLLNWRSLQSEVRQTANWRPWIAIVTLCMVCAPGVRRGGYPEVTFGDGGMVRGPRTVENVLANMKRIEPRLYYLYSEAIGPDSTLEGVIHLRIEIDRRGRPLFAGIHASTINKEELEDLILAAIMESTFDEWKDGRGITEIIYPLALTRAAAAAAPKSRSRRVFEQRQEILRKTRETSKKAQKKDEWDRWYGEDGEGAGQEW